MPRLGEDVRHRNIVLVFGEKSLLYWKLLGAVEHFNKAKMN